MEAKKDLSFEERKFLAMTYCPTVTRSIVGADSFHFSVRNGKRWFQIAQITKKFLSSNRQQLTFDNSQLTPRKIVEHSFLLSVKEL
jgi:hypothetical protein